MRDLYCAMNYVECGGLFTLSFEGPPLSAARACPGVLQLCDYLRAAYIR